MAYPGCVNPVHGIFVKKQAEGLLKLNYKIVVVAPRLYRKDKKYCVENGIPIYRFPFFTKNKLLGEYKKVPIFRLLSFLISGIWVTLRVARQENCELVHAHWAVPTGLIGVIASKYLSKRALIITIHGSDINIYPKKSSLIHILTQFVLKKSDIIIAVSDELKKAIVNDFNVSPQKVKVIPVGVDTQFFTPLPKVKARKELGLPKEQNILLFAGGLAPVKGFRYLLDAMPEIVRSHSNTLLIVIGKGGSEEIEEVVRKVKEVGLDRNLKFAGQRPPSEMPLWMAAADLLVAPSLKEGFGVVALEAISCGTPVIASRVGGFPDIINATQGGFLIEPANLSHLAQHINQFLEKKGRGELTFKTFNIPKKYLQEENTKKVAQLYSKLLPPKELPTYNSNYFTLLRHEYECSSRWKRVRIKNVLSLAPPKENQEVLDIGCGIGTFVIEYSKHGAQVTGLDVSQGVLDVANELFASYGKGKARFVQGNATSLPFPDARYDLVICADLVEHLSPKDYLKMLQESWRILKEGGKLAIYTPCPTHIFELLRKNSFILKRDETHIDIKPLEYLKETLKQNRFYVEKAYYASSHLVIFSIIEKLLMNWPVVGKYFRRRICLLAQKIGC
jgi:glycosyltransferase involved in cell wall biosynthesis/ubiquinone/menaquinone biosynthesis C-methylase UbiE